MKILKNKSKKNSDIANKSTTPPKALRYMVKSLDDNISIIKNEMGYSSDLVINITNVENHQGLEFASLYITNLADTSIINSLSKEISELLNNSNILIPKNPNDYFELFMDSLTSFREFEEGSDFNKLLDSLLLGRTIVIIDGCDRYFSVDTFVPKSRNVDEPTAQTTIRGPKEGFVESIKINVGLIRKRIKDKALRVDDLCIGDITKTKVSLMYIENIAKPEIVKEVKRRLENIKIDAILDSGTIEELIKDDRYSMFPEFLNSEKPDSVVAGLLEGRVAIVVDGTPFVLTAPGLFVEFLQASEDYYHNFFVSSFIRLTRYIAFFLTSFVPSLYIALTTFHQEMIPTNLLISIAAQREGVPFPAVIEVLLMEAIFEILREAGIRMPRVIGPAISIVGALVLGQAAVEAGIISAAMVIVVSITAISSFAIPNYSMANAARIVRFVMMIFAWIYGLYGVFMLAFVLLLHLSKCKSIGVPYMTSIVSVPKDTIFRFPIWKNKTRPYGVSNSNTARVNNDEAPVSPKQKGNPEYR